MLRKKKVNVSSAENLRNEEWYLQDLTKNFKVYITKTIHKSRSRKLFGFYFYSANISETPTIYVDILSALENNRAMQYPYISIAVPLQCIVPLLRAKHLIENTLLIAALNTDIYSNK